MKTKKTGERKVPTFDIIAGTSIGAMNTAVLTSYVIENGPYEGSTERLIDFRNYSSKESMIDSDPSFKPSIDYLHNINNAIPTEKQPEVLFSRKFAICDTKHLFSSHTYA